MPRMTKKVFEQSVRAEIDRLWHETNTRIKEMEPEKDNPQVASMITKNRGYMLALEDITEVILRLR